MSIRSLQKNNGFSLIDLIIGLSIITISFTVFMVSSANISSAEERSEIIIDATHIANNIMENIRTHRFDENISPPYSTSMGREETGTVFDDIDDFSNYTWTNFESNFYGFQVHSRVFYVDMNANWEDSTGTPSTLKRIIVEVNHPNFDSPHRLSSVMGAR